MSADVHRANMDQHEPQEGSHAQHPKELPPPPNPDDLVGNLTTLLREQTRTKAEPTRSHNENIRQLMDLHTSPSITKRACCPRCYREI